MQRNGLAYSVRYVFTKTSIIISIEYKRKKLNTLQTSNNHAMSKQLHNSAPPSHMTPVRW